MRWAGPEVGGAVSATGLVVIDKAAGVDLP